MDTSTDCVDRDTVSRRVIIWSTVALAVVVALTIVGHDLDDVDARQVALDVGVGVLACAAVPLSLRRPLPVALLMVALACLSPAATPPATFVVLLVAQWRPLRTALGVALLSVIAHAVQGMVRLPGGLSLGWWLVLDVVAHAALVGIGAMLRARQSLIISLLQRAERAEEEQGLRVAEARAAERTRMAREMHDVLGHRLSLIATYAGALEFRPDSTPDQVSRAAGVIRVAVGDAMNELRDVVRVLREDPDDEGGRSPQPSAADLAGLLEESRSAGVGVQVDGSLETLEGLPAATGRAAYRLVQEGLTNARKHAPGQPVTLVVGGAGGSAAVIEMRNASRSTSPSLATAATPAGEGLGLLGMTERVRLAGGRLDHGVRDGEFVLRATLPWPR
jgi:signal transduction histidine kinase